MIITEEQIALAEQYEACQDSLDWLRETPRTWENLANYNINWLIWALDEIPFPEEILEHLSENYDEVVRGSVISNSNITSKILSKLSEDESFWVKKKVAICTKTPREILTKLAQDPDFNIRHEISANPSTPSSVLEVMYQENAYDIHTGLAENPSTPVYILESLIKNNNDYSDYIQTMIAKNPSATKEIIDYLIEHGDTVTKGFLAQNPNISLEQTKKLVECNDNYINENFAFYSKYDEIHRILVKIPNDIIKAYLTRNLSVSSEILSEILNGFSRYVYTIENIVIHPNVTAEILDSITRKYPFLHSKVIAQPSVSKDTLKYINELCKTI